VRLLTEEGLLQDLDKSFKREAVGPGEINDFASKSFRHYLRSIIIQRSDPEAALQEVLKAIFDADDFNPQAGTGAGSIDFVVETADQGRLGIELKKYLEYDTRRRVLVQSTINPYLNTRSSWQIKSQIYRYARHDFEYLVLTNLRDWYYYDPSQCTTRRKTKPFCELSLEETYCRFGNGFLIDGIRRLQTESSKIDLGDKFFEELKGWVKDLQQLSFATGLDTETILEDVIFILNKFIFIRTLEANLVVPEDLIGREWRRLETQYPNRPKLFVRRYFEVLDSFFHFYYDTELFDPQRSETLFQHITEGDQSWRAFQQKLHLVLGIGRNDAGIRNYKFEQLDVDVFGGTYERFLAEQKNIRKARGIYYTPEYVTDYIVFKVVVPFFDQQISEIKGALDLSTPDEPRIENAIAKINDFKICDIACGSGSFLTQAYSYIWEKYTELGEYLREKADELRKGRMGQRRLSETETAHEQLIDDLLQRIGFNDRRQLAARILLTHIFGNDIDRRATEVTKLNLWLEAIRESPEDFKHDLLPATASFVLPSLSLNVTVGDAILGSAVRESVEDIRTSYTDRIKDLSELRNRYLNDPTSESSIKAAVRLRDDLGTELTRKFDAHGHIFHPSHYSLVFWPAFFDSDGKTKSNQGFHAVVGNPPYGKEQTDAAREIMNYRSAFDTYTIFMERAFELLRSDGRLGYIVPVSWQTAPDFEAFRSYVVREKFVENIVNLPFDTFKDAYVDCGIVIIGNWSPLD